MTRDAATSAYPASAHRESRQDELVRFIRATGFGHLISTGGAELYATSVPFLVRAAAGEVVLEAHLQRGNPQWRVMGAEALALFQGPHAYVHPGWYETKKEDGKAVPTWNYITVQARGPIEIIDGDQRWLRAHVEALSAVHEAGRADPWRVGDAPAGYIDALLRGIVGLRLKVREFDGRWKLSQNHAEVNRRGIIAGLADSSQAAAQQVSQAMAKLERERS